MKILETCLTASIFIAVVLVSTGCSTISWAYDSTATDAGAGPGAVGGGALVETELVQDVPDLLVTEQG